MIRIEINTDNAAFADDPGIEVGRILHRLADALQNHEVKLADGGGLQDINGNRVGRFWEITGKEA